MFEGEQPLFNFVVPDELLAAAVSKSRDKAAVADVALMPGTGEGKPPPLMGILREHGFAPLVLLTVAAMVTDTIVNGIGILGPEIKRSFHLSDTGLGAVIFVGAVAQIAWGMPVAVFADRGSRKKVAGITLLIFSATVPLMALVHNVWPFVFFYLVAAIGLGSSDTVHNAYLADAYPTNGRARVFTWHNMNDPVSQTIGILLIGYI
jgi:MFS family permease